MHIRKQAPVTLREARILTAGVQREFNRGRRPKRGLAVLEQSGGRRLESLSIVHGGWHEAIGVALFGDISDAREGEVIADERELIVCRHIENPLPCVGGRTGVRIKAKDPFGVAKGNCGVCKGVARKEEILAPRRQEIRRVTRRVTTARYDAHTFDGFFAVLDENHAVLVGQ